MIIKGLKAENFMRFERFELRTLPERGLIGIFGDNECGKSSVGELMCFSLFGRTPKSPEGEPGNIVRWGQDTCTAEITFSNEAGTYRIMRRLSADGTTDGRMIDAADNSVLAATAGEIEPRVTELLGFSFKEFRYTMFIAQKELDIILHSADDRRLVLNNMLGVGFMEKMAKKVSAKRADRDVELRFVRERIEEKNEVMEVYRAREQDMERLRDRLDAVSSKLTDALKERDRIVSTLAMLEDIRRKSEQIEVLDMRIKSRREQLRQIDADCSKLIRDADRVPEMRRECAEKAALIEELRGPRTADLQNKFRALDEYRDMVTMRDQVMNQLEIKEAALGDPTRKLDHIKKSESEMREMQAELLNIEHFIRSYSDPDKLRVISSELMKDLEFLESELARAKESVKLEQEKANAERASIEKQLERLRRQMLASSVDGIDPDELLRLQGAERSRARARDIALALAGACLVTGVVLTLALANMALLSILLGIVPAMAAAVFIQSKLRFVRQMIQDLQRQSYAYNITQRGLLDIREAIEEAEEKLEKCKAEQTATAETLNRFAPIKTGSFEDLERSASMLAAAGIRELERARGMMKDIVEKYAPLRSMAGGDQNFAQIANLQPEQLLEDKEKSRADKEERIRKIQVIIEPKFRLIDQSEGLLNAIGNIKGQIGRIEAGMVSIGISDEDEPRLKQEEKEIELRIEQLEREIESAELDIKRIEAMAYEATRLESRKRDIIDSIDEDLIKYYEIKEHTQNIDCSDRRFAELTTEREKQENTVLEQRAAISEIEAEKNVVRADLDRIPALKEEIDRFAAELNSKETYILKLRELENLFLQTGLNIRKRMVPQIESYFGWILPKMTRGRYHKVRLSDDFNVKVYSDESGGYVDLDTLSGGTVDQLLISLRLAFARATTAQSGDHGRLLFLDEPFSSFDESRRELFFKLLDTLKTNFQQIFLISHLPDLEDFVDHYIQVDLSHEQPVIASWL